MSKNVDFKHSFNLVVLSREQVGSCNHASVIHQDGDIPNVLFHLLDRKKPRKVRVVSYQKNARLWKMSDNLILNVVPFRGRKMAPHFQVWKELCSSTMKSGLALMLLP